MTITNEEIVEYSTFATKYCKKMKYSPFIPRIMDYLFKERDKYRKLMDGYERGTREWTLAWNKSEYVKQLANGVYGLMSYQGFRLYTPLLSESTTYLGRRVLEWTKKIAVSNGYTVIYADTDSNFIMGLGSNIDTIMINSEKLRKKMNDSYSDFMAQYGVKEHRLSIKFEEIFDRVVFVGAKKRYFGHMVFKRGKNVDLLEVVGFELRRSDTSPFTKNFQREFMDMVLKKKPKEEIDRFIWDKMVELKKAKISDIAIPKGIIMDLDKYLTDTNVVKGAKYANAFMGKNYDSGDKVKAIYIKHVPVGMPAEINGKKLDCIVFEEEVDIKGFVIDYDKMTQLLILKKIESIYAALGWGDFISDRYQKTLVGWSDDGHGVLPTLRNVDNTKTDKDYFF